MDPVQDRIVAPVEPIAEIQAVEPEIADEGETNADAAFVNAFARSEELLQTQQKRKNICVAVTGTVVAFLVGLAKYPDFRAWQDARVFAQIESLSANATTHGQAVSLLPHISGYSPELFNKSVAHVLGQDHANYTSIAAAMLNLGETRQKYLDQQLSAYKSKRILDPIKKLLNTNQFDEAATLAQTISKENDPELTLHQYMVAFNEAALLQIDKLLAKKEWEKAFALAQKMPFEENNLSLQYDRKLASWRCQNAFNDDALSQIKELLPKIEWEKALDLAEKMTTTVWFQKAQAYDLIINKLIDRISLRATDQYMIRALAHARQIVYIVYPGNDVDGILADRARTSNDADLIIPFISNDKLKLDTIDASISHIRQNIAKKTEGMLTAEHRVLSTEKQYKLIRKLEALRTKIEKN